MSSLLQIKNNRDDLNAKSIFNVRPIYTRYEKPSVYSINRAQYTQFLKEAYYKFL